jgi:hypothetical protein
MTAALKATKIPYVLEASGKAARADAAYHSGLVNPPPQLCGGDLGRHLF